jgi:hypothetical protein
MLKSGCRFGEDVDHRLQGGHENPVCTKVLSVHAEAVRRKLRLLASDLPMSAKSETAPLGAVFVIA